MKWIWEVLLKIQSRHDSVHRRMDRRTDGQTDERTNGQTDRWCEAGIPPFQLRWSGGYKKCVWANDAHIIQALNSLCDTMNYWSYGMVVVLAGILVDIRPKYGKGKRYHYKNQDLNDDRVKGQTDGRTDGQTDRRTRWYQYTPLSTSLKRGYSYDYPQLFICTGDCSWVFMIFFYDTHCFETANNRHAITCLLSHSPLRDFNSISCR